MPSALWRHLYAQIWPPISGDLFVSNPQALQQILTQDTRDDFSAPGDLNDLFKSLLGDRSVITLSGIEHQRQRQLMMPASDGDRMRAYRQTIDRVTAETIENIPVGDTFDVRETTQAITLRVMMAAVFGLNAGECAAKLEQLLVRLLDRGSSPLSVMTDRELRDESIVSETVAASRTNC